MPTGSRAARQAIGKAPLEERWMAEHHTAYAAYRARTKRFVPFLF
jgi:protein-S-isoprenylcysteine O-methyltransferase Ste14